MRYRYTPLNLPELNLYQALCVSVHQGLAGLLCHTLRNLLLKIPENLVSLLAKASYLSELSTEVEGVDVFGADVPTDGSVEVDDVMEVDDEVPPQAANKLIDNIPNINDFFLM